MKDKKHIDEQNIDGLLNKLFLEEHAAKTNESMAQFVFQQDYDVTIDTGKEKELMDKLNGTPKGPGSYLNLLIIAFVAIAIGVGILLYNEYKQVNPADSQQHVAERTDNKPAEEILNRTGSKPVTPLEASKINDSVPGKTPGAVTNKNITTTLRPTYAPTDVSVYFPHTIVGSKSATTFFNPTEEDLEMYGKVKIKMLEKLLHLDKETYATIEEGEIQYKGNALALYPFVLRNQAITNLEYKVFLSDLLKHGKKDEFKKAIIRSEAWVSYSENVLATTYFFDEKYNDFPVVNVNPLATFLFCDWLEKEINQYSQQLNSKAAPLKVRLPFDSEWIFATRRGYAQIPDCGGYNTIYDVQDGIVDINYLKRIELIKKRGKSKRTILDDLFLTNRYGISEDQTLRLFEQAFNYTGKAVTDSLYPNRMDIYSKAAHVSEIALDQQTGNVLVVGSCWKNKQEYTNMLTEFKKTAASPFVGFRVVIVTDSKASYKDPFW
jgi:hypothetical protein